MPGAFTCKYFYTAMFVLCMFSFYMHALSQGGFQSHMLFSLSETVLEAIVAVWIWHTSDGTPSFGHALLAHAVYKCLAVGKMVGNPGEKKRRNRVLTDHHLPQKHKIAVSIRHVKSSRARGSMMAPLRDILAEEAAMFRIRRSMHICLKHLTG